MTKIHYLLLTLAILFTTNLRAQEIKDGKIKEQIVLYKNDIRGPYRSIQWFCDDGTKRVSKDPCPKEIGGIQHATYKNEVIALGEKNHIFLGQILAYTDKTDFWDASKNHSRLKQYQLGRYLARIDDGWFNRKGQFYRGSIQIEDEEAWGIAFYKWLLVKDDVLVKDYYLVLQSLKDIPHPGDDDLSQLMRAQSKVISDQFSKFMDLRVKIHSNPEPIDIEKTLEFKKANAAKTTTSLNKKLDELVSTMQKFHKPISLELLSKQVNKLQGESGLKTNLKKYIEKNSNSTDVASFTKETAMVLLDIRKNIVTLKGALQRLQLLDIANKLEGIIFKKAAEWNPKTLAEQLEKVHALAMAAAGTGAIELWEWEQVSETLQPSTSKNVTLGSLTKKLATARGVVEWSSAMVKANYQDVVNTYTAFEPKAYSFIDDRIRSSIALQLGKTVGDLGAFIAKESSLSNKVMNLSNQSSVRGLNPGYAYFKLPHHQIFKFKNSTCSIKISQ